MSKISIIMPVYNGERFISEAIQSVLGQTWQDWELLVTDDGSTDHTAELVTSHSDSRIHLVCRPNMGRGAARNIGLDLAEGDYIVFLDCDDLLLPTALASNANHLLDEPSVGVVYSDGFYCDAQGNPLSRFSQHRLANASGCVLDVIAISPLLGGTCCAMVRRSAIERQRIRFDTELVYGEDWSLFVQLATAECFAYNPGVTCKYRIHGENTILRQANRRTSDLAKVRLGILRSPVFPNLSPSARETLSYQLLFENFSDDPHRQHEIVTAREFELLAPHCQAKILRLVAAHWLLNRWSTPGALEYLRRAMTIYPPDQTTRAVSIAARVCPTVARLALYARRRLGLLHHRPSVPTPFLANRSEGT